MRPLAVSRMHCEFRGFLLDCIWYPACTLDADEQIRLVADADAVNSGRVRLDYGFFDPAAAGRREEFLKTSIWCLIRRGDTPYGFAYNVDLGEVGGRRVVHQGLVKFRRRLGRAMMIAAYVPLGLGNFLNFGQHVATNITHLPLIVELFGLLARDVFPAAGAPDLALGESYLPALHLLEEAYIRPYLGVPPGVLCERTYRLCGSLAGAGHGFETRWDALPKALDPECNAFVAGWLGPRRGEDGRLRVQDDLIQAGTVDWRAFGSPEVAGCLDDLRFNMIAGGLGACPVGPTGQTGRGGDRSSEEDRT